MVRSRRRQLLRAATLPAFAAVLGPTACGWPIGPQSQQKVVTLALPTGAPAYDDVAAAVERAATLANSASRPPFTIKPVRVPLPQRAAGGQFAQGMARLLAGDEAADIVLVVSRTNDASLPAGEVLDLVARQHLAPLDDLAKNDKAYQPAAFSPAALDALRHQGKAYARPLSIEPLVLYYDPELFGAAGVRPPDPSWDWAMLRDAARRLTRDTPGGQPDQWGLYSYPPLWYLLGLVWQNGGEIVAADGRTPQIADRPAVEALEYLYDLIAVRRLAPPPPAPSGTSPYALRYDGGRIYAGPSRVAMAIGPGATDLRQALLEYGLPDVQALGVAELAQGKQRATALRVVSALGVTAAAKDKPTAYEALALLEREATQQLALSARRPGADQIRQRAPALNAASATTLANAVGYARVIRLSNLLASQRVAAALWQTAIGGMFGGGLTPSAAAAAAAQQIETILAA